MVLTAGSRLNTYEVLVIGERQVLFENAHGPYYVPTGHIIFYRSRAMWAAVFDVETLEVRGESVPIQEDIHAPFGWSAELTFSNEGTLAYVSGRSVEETRVTSPVWVGRDGSAEFVAELFDRPYMDPRVSPDGRQLLLSSYSFERTPLVWILELQRSTLSRFTTQTGMRAFWTPSGDAIVFASSRDGPSNIYLKPVDGARSAEQLTSGEYRVPTATTSLLTASAF